MKKKVKQILSALLVAVMLVGIAPIGGIDFAPKAKAMDLSSYKVGDLIEFGSYPQSEVKDKLLIKELDNTTKNWKSYGYYSGNGFCDGNNKPSDYMQYSDISFNGDKFRAVKFSYYRPGTTFEVITTDKSGQNQYENGYIVNTVYYFKFESLTWRVLDPTEGYVVCNSIIDSQAYQNFKYRVDRKYPPAFNSKECVNYASDWSTCSLRNWLNNDFYNTAFSQNEKEQIGKSYLENNDISEYKGFTEESIYSGKPTYDKIFVMSYYDVKNNSYGFDYDEIQSGKQSYKIGEFTGTDYAKSQGLDVRMSTENIEASLVRLRTPLLSENVSVISSFGYIVIDGELCSTNLGIVPAFKFNPKNSHAHTVNHITVPSTCKIVGMEYDICSECGETFNEKTLPLAAHTWGEWTIVKEATTTAEGQEKRTCSVCNKVETRAIEKLKVIKDDKTGIEINYNDEYDSDTEIKVEEQFSGKSFQLINTEFGKVNSKIYDIATYKDGVKVQPNGEITVKVPLPDGFTTNKVFVCYVDSVSGKVTKIPCEVKDGYVIFKTNHFSEYAIVEQSANVKSVSVSDITLNYKKSATIKPTIKADEGAKYTVKYSSSNTKVATVDENGKIYGAKKGNATITCTVTDSYGNVVTDKCNVNVDYSGAQWFIIIVLFGWIWYI